MKILRAITDHGGYPSDYFFARLRARRAALPRDQQSRSEEAHKSLAFDQEDLAWRLLQGELLWCFRQMNGELRGIFQTVFVFLELKTIILCLRYQSAAKRNRIDAILERSLLTRNIKKALLAEPQEVATTIPRIAACFGPEFSKAVRDEVENESEMIKRFESILFTFFLQQAIRPGSCKEITHFFQLQIDLRNFMLAAKNHRWAIQEPAQLIADGCIAPKKILAAISLQNSDASNRALAGSWATDLPLAGSPHLEVALLQRIALILSRKARLGGGITLTLDYLWQRYLAGRNASLLSQANQLPIELLKGEIIQ